MSKTVLRVAVIEDDVQDFVLVKLALDKSERIRYQADHIADYSAALELLYADNYDIILLDHFLGEHRGLELLTHARKIQLPIPIIMLTGNSSDELDEQLMKEGAADYLPKDELSSSLLDRAIRHALERKRSELKIAQLIRRDPLTGLGNRVLFEEHMELAIARAERNGSQLGVVFLDLDRFKDVNDSLGHHVGDLLLTLVADRLRRTVRKSDFVARIGGDEFLVLLDNIESVEDAEHIVRKISEALSRPAPVSTVSLNVSCSIGVALYPGDGNLGIELMQKADMALYEAKAQGPGNYHFFTEHLQQRLVQNLELEKALRAAIGSEQFQLHYQPQVDAERQQIVGVEALLRWTREDGSKVAPDVFIPVAVHSGLIIPLGMWVLENACRQIRHWLDEGMRVPIAINVSPRQLKYPGFVDDLLACIAKYQLPPNLLEIELTEEALIETGSAYTNMLRSIRSAGVQIAVDDFGTGYSSMRYLREFPLDCIKIDRSFISQPAQPQLAEPAITRAIVALAQGLAMEVIAEGVESGAQMEALQAMGCDWCQGHFFYQAMPAELLEPVLREKLATNLRGKQRELSKGTFE